MTIDRIPAIPPSLLSSVRGAGSTVDVVRASTGAVAVQALGPIAGEFLRGGGGPANASAEALRELGSALAESLGASPVETVELERALESLAGALAADLVAFADGRTLDRLDAAIAAVEGEPAMNQAPAAGLVARIIEDIAAHVGAA